MNPHHDITMISAYLDRALEGEEKFLLEAHLVTCVSCREELEDLRGIQAALARVPRKKLPAVLRTHLQKETRRFRWRWIWNQWRIPLSSWPVGVMLALVVLVGVSWERVWSPVPPLPVEPLLSAHNRYGDDSEESSGLLPGVLPNAMELESARRFLLNGEIIHHYRYTNGKENLSIFSSRRPIDLAFHPPASNVSPQAVSGFRGQGYITLVGDQSKGDLQSLWEQLE